MLQSTGDERSADTSGRDTIEADYLRAQLVTLAGLATDLAGQFELQPLLERILRQAVALLDCESGSICLIDETTRVYRKEVDLGVDCSQGQTFSLDEGVTGEIVRANGVVVLDEYADVTGGHVREPERSSLHAVIGVPIRWRGSMIGSCVVFSRTKGRRFTAADAELLELFAKHAAIAIINSRLHIEAQERAKQSATAAERERVVRDVHDTVGRGLASVLLHLEAAEREAAGRHGALESLRYAREAAHDALAETRRTVLGLAPTLLDGRSLAEALGLELAWAQSTANLSGQLVTLGDSRSIAPDTAYALFKMTQEALTNVISHADARTVRLGLIYGDDTVSVLVEDDGRGFELAAVPGSEAELQGQQVKLGLQGLAARARRLGGMVTVDSTPGWGTTVRISVAYAAHPPEGAPHPQWRVVLVHERAIVRAGLVRLLSLAEPDIQVVAELSSTEQAVEAFRLLRPDVVIATISHPETAAALMRDLRGEDPDAAVVFLLEGTYEAAVTGELARTGARGFVDHDADGAGLARAVIAAGRGETLMPVGVFASATAAQRSDDSTELTKREVEIRGLLVRGLSNKAIAAQLQISVKTVERHVGSLLKKTGADNRTMLAGAFRFAP